LETHYKYDASGNLVQRTSANGATVEYSYDAVNRLTHILYPDDSEVLYGYDEMGRRIQMADRLGTTNYEYDRLNRLISVTDANGNQVRYEYDLADNLTALTYPDGSAVHYMYDGQNRLVQIDDAVGTITFTYDETGQLVGRGFPNGVRSDYAYDSDGRLIAIHHIDADGRTLLSFEYTLDVNGNCIEMVRTAEDGEQLTTRYTYDELERLKDVAHPDGRLEQYTYDSVGNRLMTSAPEGQTAYVYDETNRLLSLTHADGSAIHLTYDANGNVIERRSSSAVSSYAYDHEDRLIRVEDGTQVVQFEHDGDGNRVAKIVDGVRTEYANHIGGPWPYVLSEHSAGKEVRYILGRQPLVQISATTGEVLYQLEDRLGSTVALADASGQLVSTFDYDVLGAPTMGDETQSSHGFTGGRYDAETGLVYLRARFYEPRLGRFINGDPFRGFLTNPQSQNLAAYMVNNPKNLVTPPGLQPPYTGQRYDQMAPQAGIGWPAPNTWPEAVHSAEPYHPGSIPHPAVTALHQAPLHPIRHDVSPAALLRHTMWQGPTAVLPGLGGLAQSSMGLCPPAVIGHSVPYMAIHAPGCSIPQEVYAEARRRSAERIPTMTWGWIRYCVRGACWWMRVPFGSSTHTVYIELGDYGDGHQPYPSPLGPRGLSYGDHGSNRGGVGGVRLDKAAEMLTDLNDIVGVTYDPVTGQLILLGRKDLRLPPLALDDLAVAIQAAYVPVEQLDGAHLFESPGISIEPLDPMHPDVRHAEMAVHYFSHTEGTAFGEVLFEADRFLKTLDHGIDNLTGERVNPGVPGYRSMLELWRDSPGTSDCPRWHRKWFFIDQVRLRETDDGRAMAFEEGVNPIRLEARFVRWVNGEKVDVACSDAAVEASVQHVNEHYNGYAQTEPSLSKLQQLARIAALVQWIRENEIPLDMSWISRYQIQALDTPKRTPALTTTISLDSVHRSIYGGVDLVLARGENLYVEPDDGQVAHMAQAVLASRPSDVAIAWDVAMDGESHRAVALTLAPSPIVGGHSVRQTDLVVPVLGDWPLALMRGYSSLDPLLGPLGYGWTLAPFSLDNPRSLQDEAGTPYEMFELLVSNDGQHVAFDVMHQRMIDPEVGFVSPPTVSGTDYMGITQEMRLGQAIYRVWRQDRRHLLFDAGGRLISLAGRDGNETEYRYDAAGRLEAIVGPGKRGYIHLEYDSQGRIARAIASTGEEVRYGYSDAGDLTEVTLPGSHRLTYTYDTAHRLTSVALNGILIEENRYDSLGRLLERIDASERSMAAAYDRQTGQVTWSDPAGGSYHRSYDASGHLLSSVDPLGHTTIYGYDGEGNLASATDATGNTTRLEHDDLGRLTAWSDALGNRYEVARVTDSNGNAVAFICAPDDSATAFTYDGQGRLISVQEGYGHVERTAGGISFVPESALARQTVFHYDSVGRLAGYQQFAQDSAGQRSAVNPAIEFLYNDLGWPTAIHVGGQAVEERSYDALGRLTSFCAPQGQRLRLTYDDTGRLTALSSPGAETRYTYDDLGRVVQTTGPLGHVTSYQYDAAGNLAQVTEANGATTRYQYDAQGNLIMVTDANGHEIHYLYDQAGRLIQTTEVVASLPRL